MTGREDRPGDAQGEAGEIPPPDPKQLRLLKNVVAILGVLIFLALAALVAGIIYKGKKTGGEARGRWLTPLVASVPPGARMGAMILDGDRLVVQAAHPDGGGELLIFDLRKKGLTGRIELKPR